MTLNEMMEAIEARHSVRAYKDIPIEQGVRNQLDAFIDECNKESGLNITVQYGDPEGFDSRLAHYGSFRNVKNYIVLKGKKGADFDFLCGYYGEKLVLFAQQQGLNSCWAALTYNRRLVRELIPEGEALCMVIALGYGQTQGVPHRSKPLDSVIEGAGTRPDWFTRGVEAALKAPTAVNQQKFAFSLADGEPFVRVKGLGSCTAVDLGIVAFHFEAASGRKVRH